MESFKIRKNALALFLVLLFAAPPLYAGGTIAEVRFVGVTKMQEGLAKKYISSREGTTYSSVTVRRDIKALYESGYFQDVSVEKKAVKGGISLVFHVTEKGVVQEISFEGNKKIKDKALFNAISFRRNSPIDEKRLSDSEQAIQKLYEDKGYQITEVVADVVPIEGGAPGDVAIVFRVSENKGARIKRIAFVGNKAIPDKKLAKQMTTKVKGLMSILGGGGKLKDEKLERDIDALTYYYLNNGYLKAKIGKPQISVTRDKKAIYITIPVYEGLKYKVARVDVGGDILTTREELRSKFKLKAGLQYTRKAQDEDIQYLMGVYGNQAYAFANIYPLIQTNDEEKTADMTYTIEKGRKIIIERIEIRGNNITRDKVVRRELQVKENAPFNRAALDRSKDRLYQLGFFSDVNFSTPRGSSDDKIVLVVDVKEKQTGSFSIGAGFSSLESFVFNASVQKDNFFGYGIGGGISASISKLRQEFSLNFIDRYFLDSRWMLSASAYRYFSRLNRDFDQKSLGGSLSFGREVFPYLSVSLGYQIQDIAVTNFSSAVPGFFRKHSSGLTSSILSTVAYDRRDNRLTTSKGYYGAVSNEYAGNGLGGSNDYWKLTTDVRGFVPLPLKSVLKGRGLFSYVNSLNQDAVPLFERFFLGGINTLRGYDLNSIGPELRIPRSPTGPDRKFVYGGNRMLLFNVEYEIPIVNSAGLRSVVFLDTGQAFGENEGIDLTKFRSDYGFGLRWNSPFGPLRFEWGFPIMKKKGESFSVFNFSIGQSF